MAAKFEFRNNLLELDIAGKTFKIDTTSQTIFDAMQKFRDGAKKLAEEIKTIPETEMSKFVEKERLFLIESIDDILGAGAVSDIFGERPVTYFDALDVARFISVEIPKYIADKSEEFARPVPANRAQRRASGKKKGKAVENEPAD